MKQSTNILFRCSILDKKIIRNKAKKTGLTVSEYCRKSALEKVLQQKLTEDEIEIYKMLVKYHNNFTSISNMLKQRNPKNYETIMDLVAEIKKHLTQFKPK